MPATASGARSNSVTSAGGSCDAAVDPGAGLDLAAQVGQQRRQRVGDRLRPAGRDRPAVPVAGGEDAQPDRRGHRVVQRPEGVRRNAAEQRPRLGRCGTPGRASTPGSTVGAPNRASVSGWCGTRSSGPMMSSASASKRADGRPNSAPPPGAVGAEPGGGVARPSGAAPRRCRRRAGARSRSPASASAARSGPGPARSRNGEPTAIGWIAEQWSCSRPGSDRLAGAGAAADLVGGLEHGDLRRPRLARATAAASPLGPPPTTVAVLMPALRARRRARGPRSARLAAGAVTR